MEHSNAALEWAESIKKSSLELAKTISDIQSMAYLGKYNAHKIKAATYLALFRKTLDKNDHEKMLNEQRTSAIYWRYYASNSLSRNINPLWTNRVGHVDWKETNRNVYYEIKSKGEALNIPSMEATPGGVVLEAEDAEFQVAEVDSKISGYTGKGYLSSKHGHAVVPVKWTFNAPQDGDYALEFRYSLSRQKQFESPLKINGEKVDDMWFWMSGEPKSWVWDKYYVHLSKGNNSIEISPEGLMNIDHLNIIKY